MASPFADSDHTATLGIGGNIGDVVNTMRKALDVLAATDGLKITSISPLYKTPPWGVEDQDWFVNACLMVSCRFSPQNLLSACFATELFLKRKREKRWGPRNIDIDVLTFNGFSSDDPVLTIPHPRMLERAFVLVPLNDIAADMHVSGKPVSHWLGRIDHSEIEKLEIEMPWWPA